VRERLMGRAQIWLCGVSMHCGGSQPAFLIWRSEAV
jgi:hypothetical protein